MRSLFVAGLIGMSLTACTPASETAVIDESPAPEVAETPTPTRDSCKDIAALAAAMKEPEPFLSLRTGNAKLGDRVLYDHFTTAVAPAGASCALGRIEAFNAASGDVYVANCLVFSSGILDREADAVKAKAAFDAARSDLEACLPKDWSARDGSRPEANATEVMVYESAADAKRSMDASSYLYPVELRKEWSEGGKASPPGWRVTLNFQKEQATKPAQQ